MLNIDEVDTSYAEGWSLFSEDSGKEKWKPYRNSPYQVSNMGRVQRDGQILKPRPNPGGYLYMNLSYNGHSEQPAVHAMVLEAFGSKKPHEGAIVLHKDNNKQNNKISNLSWGGVNENTKDAYDDGLIKDKGANAKE